MAKPVILAVDDDPQVLSAVVRDIRTHFGGAYSIVKAQSGAVGAIPMLFNVRNLMQIVRKQTRRYNVLTGKTYTAPTQDWKAKSPTLWIGLSA